MSISSTISIKIYIPNGSIQDFAFPYYVNNISDIKVMNRAGPIVYVLGTDYVINDIPDNFGSFPLGLTVHFLVAPPSVSGAAIMITRKTELIQSVQFINNDPFTAESLNHALNRIVLMIQDQMPGILDSSFKGAAFGPPTGGLVIYAAGDWFKNAIPTNINQPFGWICVGPGAPGVWHPFGNITL